MILLLASKSPRRRELITQLGYPYRVVDVDVDEVVPQSISADKVAEYLSRCKSLAYNAPFVDDEVLVTADTVVVLDNQVLGKPSSHDDALAMLRALSGQWHTVYTGVSLRNRQCDKSFTEATHVHFKELEQSVIEYYVDRYAPYDKAGSYGIQEWIGMVGIDRIDGCFYNVMGLPLSHLYAALQEFK